MWQVAPPGTRTRNKPKEKKPVTRALRFNDDDDELLPESKDNDIIIGNHGCVTIAFFRLCIELDVKKKLE